MVLYHLLAVAGSQKVSLTIDYLRFLLVCQTSNGGLDEILFLILARETRRIIERELHSQRYSHLASVERAARKCLVAPGRSRRNRGVIVERRVMQLHRSLCL